MEFAKFEFALKTQNSFGLPDFKGSTFRGKFGHVLKRTICIMSHHKCDECELREKCAYTYLYETRNERKENVARPFVLEPPLTHQQFFLKDKYLYLNLVLIGGAIEYLPYFVYAFTQMGKEGIGQDRGKFLLTTVRAVDSAGQKHEIFDHKTQQLLTEVPRIKPDDFKAVFHPQITVQFLTPTDLRANGKRVDTVEFPVLLRAILRRYRSLQYYHNGGEKEWFEINWEAAEKIKIVHRETENRRLKRYSNRQKRPIPLGGITGKITYRGNLAPFIPWLKIGEYLHVGKGAVFGMGWYRMVG
ncbi:MAG TPA: CRISPR system precrRNA processing endoribonuclease RAMP protein Cas6 [Caldithrix sp.]|nr:CRISPR system precrRNA processing endoribonuclease RAMP protein Cas6 [Caldithrix sp.]